MANDTSGFITAGFGQLPRSTELPDDISNIPDIPPPLPSFGPSLVILGWNFATALSKWAFAGFPTCTPEEIETRLAICQACPEFTGGNHCSRCGCFCVEGNRLINKLAMKSEKCPLGKWE